MRFKIHTTSTSDWYFKPCEKAVGILTGARRENVAYNTRNFYLSKGSEELQESEKFPPFRDGIKITKRERVEGSYSFYIRYVLDIEEIEWFVEINSMEELLALQEEVGTEIILKGKVLEIYDDYRE